MIMEITLNGFEVYDLQIIKLKEYMENQDNTVVSMVVNPSVQKQQSKVRKQTVQRLAKQEWKEQSQEFYFHRPKTSYHWTHIQQKKYVNYIAEHKKVFEMPLKDKKARGIHQKMSKQIQTRTSIQCRSHHQKMLSKFGSLDAVIKQFRDLISENTLKKLVQEKILQEEAPAEMVSIARTQQVKGFVPCKRQDFVHQQPNKEINKLWYIALLGFWDYVRNNSLSMDSMSLN